MNFTPNSVLNILFILFHFITTNVSLSHCTAEETETLRLPGNIPHTSQPLSSTEMGLPTSVLSCWTTAWLASH